MRTLIRSATVIDGTEKPGYIADVMVDGDRIAEIGVISPSSATA